MTINVVVISGQTGLAKYDKLESIPRHARSMAIQGLNNRNKVHFTLPATALGFKKVNGNWIHERYIK